MLMVNYDSPKDHLESGGGSVHLVLTQGEAGLMYELLDSLREEFREQCIEGCEEYRAISGFMDKLVLQEENFRSRWN